MKKLVTVIVIVQLYSCGNIKITGKAEIKHILSLEICDVYENPRERQECLNTILEILKNQTKGEL